MRTLPAKYIRWIRQELAILTEAGALDTAGADRIRAYYNEQTAAEKHGLGWAVTIFSIIGALLIGGGIILLFAHNWDQLSRTARTILSLTPLALGASLSVTSRKVTTLQNRHLLLLN